MARASYLFTIALIAAGCGSDGESGADGGGGGDAAPFDCFLQPTTVTVELQLGDAPGCAKWPRLADLPGSAVIDASDGWKVEIDFGDGVIYRGNVLERTLLAAYAENHDFTDPCPWQAIESLQAAVGPAPGCAATATYTYRDAVIQPPMGPPRDDCEAECAGEVSGDATLLLTPN